MCCRIQGPTQAGQPAVWGLVRVGRPCWGSFVLCSLTKLFLDWMSKWLPCVTLLWLYHQKAVLWRATMMMVSTHVHQCICMTLLFRTFDDSLALQKRPQNTCTSCWLNSSPDITMTVNSHSSPTPYHTTPPSTSPHCMSCKHGCVPDSVMCWW